MIVLLILATVVDLLLAALLIGVSGFIFGGGPEGGHGEITGVLMWSLGMLMCLGCPIAGFVLRAKRQPGSGVAVAWLPPLGALVVAFFPYHPY
jgi:hypothetical protein